ncbi:MAG: hypothetical protein KDK37_05140, partial [Leptospiraceae bacterium]|nr:hypothetical protein [Leptospiraceae bacterium]
FRQERDFKYIPGPDPGERIYINLKDLHKRQKLLELMILLTGFLMISALLWSCYIYANRQIVHPVERAARVAALRMAGEELDDQETILPDNEIGELIRTQNALYLEMKMPADG